MEPENKSTETEFKRIEPNNRLAEIIADLGLQAVRPTKKQLKDWNMSLHRFNLIVKNKHQTAMTVNEMTDLKNWLRKNFKGSNQYLFEADMPAELRNKQLKMPLHQ